MPIAINGTGTITGINAGGLPDGCITTDDLAANAVTTAKLGSNEQSGLCKAWVNFNGTGTVAIRASFNVSSITDAGVGFYTVNFTTALADANYSAVATITPGSSLLPLVPGLAGDGSGPYSTTQLQLATWNQSSLATSDTARICAAVFR